MTITNKIRIIGIRIAVGTKKIDKTITAAKKTIALSWSVNR